MNNKVATSPKGLPLWLVLIGWLLLLCAASLNARLVWEQTFLTWRNGPQMVGFSLTHQHPEVVLLGFPLMILAHLWLISAAALLIVKKGRAYFTRPQWLLTALTAVTLGVGHVPYDWWKMVVINYPTPSPHLADFLPGAAAQGRLSAVKSLVAKGVNINSQITEGRYVALECAAAGDHLPVIEFLLTHGASVDLKDGVLGRTALIRAAEEGHLKAATLLLDKGANPNLEADDGATALQLAADNHHDEVVQLLKQRGAKELHTKKTIFDAIEAGNVKLLDEVIRTNPDLANAKGQFDFTPLHIAAEHRLKDITALLLQNGANPNARNDEGATPLHFAVSGGDAQIVSLLLAKGADPNARTRWGNIPLIRAASDGDKDIVELLLAAKADVGAKDDSGNTALSEAIKNNRHEVADILSQHIHSP